MSKILVIYNHTTDAASDWPHTFYSQGAVFCYIVKAVKIRSPLGKDPFPYSSELRDV